MSATVQLPSKTTIPKRKISWSLFQKKYLTREDKYKYEWVNGYVEKTLRSMNKTQFYILKNLMDFLDTLKPDLSTDWNLIPEGDTFFAGHHRRPDISFYTFEQIRAAKENEDVVPEFVIEIISSNDQMYKVDEKMDNYRSAKVKVVWHIFPKSKKVHVYYGNRMTVCQDDDICSADSVIPGFKITADDVFK